MRRGRRSYVGFAVVTFVALGASGCVTLNFEEPLTGADASVGGFSATHVFPGDYDTRDFPSVPLEPGPHWNLPLEVEVIPSPVDGVDIEIGYTLPSVPEGERVPVILVASPYLPPLAPLEGRDLSGSYLQKRFGTHGYAVVYVPVRGTGNSGGCMDLMGPAERADIDAAVTWAGTQPWSNGNVGMWGVSYYGSTQWEAASTGNPHLKTIVPIAAIPDLFDLLVHNGSAQAWTPVLFAQAYYQLYGILSYNPLNGRGLQNTFDQQVCPESWKAITISVHSALAGERDPLGFWEARNWRDDVLANYTGSVFLVHGLRDMTVDPHTAYPFVNRLADRGVVVKHLVGQWDHELPDFPAGNGYPHTPRWDFAEVTLRWFDYWLKGDTTVDLGPVAQVEDSSGRWRSEATWPPAGARPVPFHLSPGGSLSRTPTAASGKEVVAPKAVVPDPERVATFSINNILQPWDHHAFAACPACPAFRTEPFEEAFRFAGLPRLHATVTPLGPGGHLTAYLYVEDPAGEALRVGWGQMDLRFAAGGETAEPVTPGEPLVARMQLEPLDVVVPPGGRLVLVLHQGGKGTQAYSVPTYPVEVHVGGDASVLAVDAFDRAPDAFFTPPS